MIRIAVCVVCAAVSGCSSAQPTTPQSPLQEQSRRATASPAVVITETTTGPELNAAVGKWVRVEGVVSNHKIPGIAGVDVELPSVPIRNSRSWRVIELKDKPAWADGVLVRTVVRPSQSDGRIASRGPGTYYKVVDPATGHTAVAHPAAGGR